VFLKGAAMLVDTFAEYARHEAARDLPQEVIHHAKRVLLDWFSALLPGTRISPAINLVRTYAAELGHGKSSLPGFGTTAFPGTAAWINGSASHSVEFDDIYREAIYHPGCPTIGAALAIAEDRGKSGLELLKAITIGYEISTRIGAAIQPSHYKFFHTTGTVGCFGSAAAVAALTAPGDMEVMRHALATATTFASGLQQAFRSDSMTKPLHAGHAAWVGVAAGTGAANGVRGALDVLEGEAGFGAAMSQGPRWEEMTAGLGEQYNITKITQKNHGCCGHTFSSLDSTQMILEQQRIEASQIESVIVHTYKVAINVTGNFTPQGSAACRFSLPYVLAHALLYGPVRLNAFSPERQADPAIRHLMKRISVQEDPELTAKFPGMRSARVTIKLKDGRSFEQFAPNRKGDPEWPLTDAELNDKFLELTIPVIGETRARGLMEQLWNVDKLKVADLKLAALKSNAAAVGI
jgi:2-methylcitrate dehydratase PrpD